jgi:hypothetical protein
MLTDIVFILGFTFLGGLLGLVVEVNKYFSPVYLAVVLLGAAQVLGLLEKMMNLATNK